ncbi:MAG: exopolysaccharide biosynthesis polyprenyl glycosylphosphotransferase, partial [Micromonosporaceae bacterium]|nr:exopolysaccharide biosynthesis polyprenyl glycosylphosphotransferase [Micromonosporaceae bacterium]
LAAAFAFGLRFGPGVTSYNRWYLIFSLVLPLAWAACLALNRGYETRYLFVGAEEYQRVFRAGLVLLATVAIVSYGLEIRLARGYVLIALPAMVLACVAARYAQRHRLHRARAHGHYLRRVVVVGHGRAVAHLTQQLSREKFHGLQAVAACLPAGGPRQAPGLDLDVYGSFDDVADAVRQCDADTVVVLSCPELDGIELRRLAWQLERDDIDLILASALIDVAGDRTTLRPVDGLPMLHVEHPRLTGAARVAKEIFDRVGAALLLAAFAPLLAVIVVLTRRDSPGPVLFRQVRVGRDGREFTMFKFRTMHVDAERRLRQLLRRNELDGVLFKMRDDPRVTPVGRWLRRYSLDELPQLLNVLRGDMSLVGPRPALPREVAVYPDDMRRRLVVKPGLTGLWQVSGRSDLSWEDSVRLDLRYVENWSLSADLVILLRTLTAVWRASGAY